MTPIKGEPLSLAESIKHQFKVLFMKTIQLMRTQEIHSFDIKRLRSEVETLRKEMDDMQQLVADMRIDVDDIGTEVADMSDEAAEDLEEEPPIPGDFDGEIRE